MKSVANTVKEEEVRDERQANGCALQFCIDGPFLGTPSFCKKI